MVIISRTIEAISSNGGTFVINKRDGMEKGEVNGTIEVMVVMDPAC